MRRLVVLLLAEAAALGILVAAHDPLVERALPPVRPDDVVVLGTWAFALAIATWLTGSTFACVAVALVPAVPRGVHRAVAVVAPRTIRILVTRALAVSLVTSLATAPVALGTDGAPEVRTGREPVPSTQGPDARDETPDEPDVSPRAPSPRAPSSAPTPAKTSAPPLDARVEHRVAPGDHLWSIAATRLREHGMEPTDAEIAPYWARVVEANRDHLRSGDPDLVFPGEVVVLPPR